jgi:hypothetical protein
LHLSFSVSILIGMASINHFIRGETR